MSPRYVHRVTTWSSPHGPVPIAAGLPTQLTVLYGSGVWPLPFCKTHLDCNAAPSPLPYSSYTSPRWLPSLNRKINNDISKAPPSSLHHPPPSPT